MLFTQDALRSYPPPIFGLLENATYLDDRESTYLPSMVPVIESQSLEAYVVDFNGVRRLAESTGVSYLDAALAVLEADGIDPDLAVIAIDETDLIEEPDLIDLGPIVLRPISVYDEEFQFCLEAVEQYCYTGDEYYLDALLEDAHKRKRNIERAKKFSGNRSETETPPPQPTPSPAPVVTPSSMPKPSPGTIVPKEPESASSSTTRRRSNPESTVSSQSSSEPTNTQTDSSWFGRKAKLALGGAAAAGLIAGGIAAYRKHKQAPDLNVDKYKNQPRSVIAKRIASLRHIYADFLTRAKAAPNEGVKNKLKKVAAKILEAIDKLLAFLQRKADS